MTGIVGYRALAIFYTFLLISVIQALSSDHMELMLKIKVICHPWSGQTHAFHRLKTEDQEGEEPAQSHAVNQCICRKLNKGFEILKYVK